MVNQETVIIYDKNGQGRQVPKSLATPEKMAMHGYSFNNPKNQNLNKIATYNPERQSFKKSIDFLNQFAIPAGDFSKGAVLGGVEGLANAASSLGNLPIEAINLLAGSNIPTMQKTNVLTQYTPKTSSGQLGAQIGDIGGNLLGGGEAYNAAKMIPKLGNTASVLQNMGRGALAGFATGENMPGGRNVNALLGAPTGLAEQLTYNSLAKNLIEGQKKAGQQSSNLYDKVFSKVDNESNVIPQGNIDFSRIRKNIPKEERTAIDSYDKNPTIQNAHEAQSEIGSRLRELKQQQIREGSNFKKKNLVSSLKESQKSIQDALEEALVMQKNGSYEDYVKAQKFYKENVVPYFSKGNIEKYKNKELFEKDLVKRMMKNPEFMKSIPGKQNTLLKTRKVIDSLMNKGNIVPASLLGIVGLNQYDKRKNTGLYGEQ